MADGGARGAGLEQLVDEARRGFAARFGSRATVVASAPGRINVIGEHTDYNDGLALPGAVDRWVVAAVAARHDGRERIYSAAFGEEVTAPLASPLAVPAWSRIPLGVGQVLIAHLPRRAGFDAYIAGNVPVGAGLSSSAAVEMAMLNALRAAFKLPLDDLELVRTAQRVEHECLGVHTGLMDQYAAQFARRGSLLLVDFARTTHTFVDAELPGWTWLLFDSGVRHRLADTAYGERVTETRAALAQVAAADNAVSSFRELAPEHLAAVEDETLRRRLRHFITENRRVTAAVEAIAAADAQGLGEILLASHTSLRDDYGVSCTELDVLVDAAASSDACAGARMMGGGFGGCTINLVREAGVARLIDLVARRFESRFGRVPGSGRYGLAGGAFAHALSS